GVCIGGDPARRADTTGPVPSQASATRRRCGFSRRGGTPPPRPRPLPPETVLIPSAAAMLLLAVLGLLLAGAGAVPGVQTATSARAAPPQSPPSGAARLQRLADVLVRPFAPVLPEHGVSAACRQHSQFYLRALEQLAPWAMHMYDASTKVPSSIMAGNIQHLGNFDQCVGVRVADGDTGSDVFRGKHCTATVSFRMPSATGWGESALGDLLLSAANASGVSPVGGEQSAALDWALCVPSSCSGRDVEQALAARLSALTPAGTSAAKPTVSVADERCLAADGGRQNKPLLPKDIAFICLLLVTMYVMAASTIYDVLCTPAPACSATSERPAPLSRVQQLLVSFSLRRNGSALLSTACSGDTMGCMHGLRVLSISWVVLLHSFYMEAVSPNVNRAVVPKLGDSVGNMVLMNATLSTDTFLLLSGALLAVSFLRSADRGRFSFNPLSFYWHRYVRLTPVYAVVLWFYASLLIRLGSGPLWDRLVGPETDNCVLNWWTNLAYVNNFVELAAPCMNQTWYLAVDMQLFWLSPLVLVPLARWPRLGRALLAALVLVSVAVPFTVTFVGKLTGAMLYTLDQTMLGQVFVDVYTRVYNRAGPYLVGIALGCLLTAVRGRGRPGPPVARPGGTRVGRLHGHLPRRAVRRVRLLPARAPVLGPGGGAPGRRASPGSCSPASRATAVPVNALLSWGPFAPLARLSYCVYLTHYAVLMVSHGLRRSPGYFSVFLTIQDAFGTLAISFFISVVLSLAYEMPFMVLDRVLVPRGPTAKKVVSLPSDCSIATVEAHREVHREAGRPDLHAYDNAGFEKMSEK
ncbi:Nose resistant to fluoxetine protein 6, partial [Frankliniella fusca]